MKRQNSEEKISDLIQDKLSRNETEDILSDLENSGISREEIESIRYLDKLIEETPASEPSDRMDSRFYAMLEEEQRKALQGETNQMPFGYFAKSFIVRGLKIAAGIALFLLGWFASGWFGAYSKGNNEMANLSGEVKQLKETLVLSMMQQSSTIERIKAVNMVTDFETADNQLIGGLLEMLNTDSNDNVRLLALEALIRYSSMPEVRDGLISSIDKQRSPMVQLRLAEIMLALNEKRAVPGFQKILQDANLNYRVRGKMNEALVVLL